MNSVKRIFSFCLLMSLLTVACGKYNHSPIKNSILCSTTFPLPDGESKEDKFVHETLSDEDDYYMERITFPTTLTTSPRNKSVEMFLYRPHDENINAPVIVLLPMLGGKGYFSLYMAKKLVNDGYVVLRFTRKKDFLSSGQGLEFEKKLIISYVSDVIAGIKHIKKIKELASRKIGIAGVSMGGIIASLVMSIYKDIDAGVFVLSGGNWKNIYLLSDDPYISKYRKKYFHNMSLETIGNTMDESFKDIDPINFVNVIPQDRILMINALFDRSIPHTSVDDLWNALNKPDRLTIPAGHYSSILFLPWISRDITNFFHKKIIL